jgi:hypothetical protein
MANKDVPGLQDVMRAFADGNHEAVAAALAEAVDAPLLHDELAKVATVMRESAARDQLRVSRTMSALRTPLHELQKRFDELAACGLKPIAVFGKVPKRVNWQQHDVVAERTALVEGDNIGVLGGSPLNRGVICFGDLDFDDTSAYDAAVQVPSLKGRPQRVTGKAGRGAIPFPVPAGTPYRKLEWKRECDGREIAMELRSTGGHQTVVAGIHSETKQPIQWSQWSDPNSWGMVDLLSLWKEISAVLAPLGWQPKHTFTAEDLERVVPAEGIEPPTFGLQNRCSTAELSRRLSAELAVSQSRDKSARAGVLEHFGKAYGAAPRLGRNHARHVTKACDSAATAHC